MRSSQAPWVRGLLVVHRAPHGEQKRLGLRADEAALSGLVPVANFSNHSSCFMPLILVGIFITPFFFELAAIVFAGVLAFHLVTLPVEFNAPTRAYGQLTRYGFLSHKKGYQW